MSKLHLHCHICGKPLPDYFVCVSPAADTDHPFLVHRGDCHKQLDKTMHVLEAALRREPAPKKK